MSIQILNIPATAQIGSNNLFYITATGGPANGSVHVVNTTTGKTFDFTLDATGTKVVSFYLSAPTGQQIITSTVSNGSTQVYTTSTTIIAYNTLLATTLVTATANLSVNQVAATFTPVKATGGDGALTWTITPALPTGLHISSTTGAISGTPTQSSTSCAYTIKATDASGQTSSQVLNLAVSYPQLTVSQDLNLSTQSFGINQQVVPFVPVTASGGVGTLTWSINPSLPVGMTFNTTNGLISGRPTAFHAATTYSITVTDQATPRQTGVLQVRFSVGAPTLTITSSISDQVLTVGQPMSISPTAAGGFGTLTWSIAPSLPPGLTFNSTNGHITGSPLATRSTVQYTLSVADQSAQHAQATFNILISSHLALTTNKLSDLELIAGQRIPLYHLPVESIGGYGAQTWSVSPALPDGLILDTTNGQISGTPTTPSAITVYTFTVTDSSSVPQTAHQQINITIFSALSSNQILSNQTLIVNQPVVPFVPVTASGGFSTGGYTYSISPSLPSGLTFNNINGQISGTPGIINTATYTITVTDRLNESSSKPFVLRVQQTLGGATGGSNASILNLVNQNTIISTDVYNQLATTISDIMSPTPTGYGFAGSAVSTVTSAMQITWIDWQKLFFETNLINTHLTGSPITLPDGQPIVYTTSTVITAAYVDSIVAATNNAIINRYSVAPSQLCSTATITDTSHDTWSSTITSTVKISSNDADTVQYFFNLGGYIQPVLSSSVTGLRRVDVEALWEDLIDEANLLIKNNPYDRILYNQGVGSHTFKTSVNSNGDFISIEYNQVSPTEIDFTTVMFVNTDGKFGNYPDSNVAKNLKIQNDVKVFYSVGALPAVTPLNNATGVIASFGQGGQTIIPNIGILKCDVTQLNYPMNQYDESARQTVNLTNIGNRPINILAIVFSNNQNNNGPVPNLYQSWETSNSNIVTTVQPGASVHFDVSYVSQGLGIYNNFVHVLSDSDNGHGIIAIKTQQNVGGPVFRPRLGTTSTYNVDVTNYHVLTDQLNIQTTQYAPLGSWTTGTCSVMWNDINLIDPENNHTEIFNITHMPDGPMITFNPEGFLKFYRETNPDAGSLQTVITANISVDCINKGVPGSPADLAHPVNTSTTIILNLDLPADFHIGHWLSPTSLNNAVVGMSYDMIGLQPYLTIGVGVDAALLNNGQLTDPLPSQIADAGYNLNWQNLAGAGDSAWGTGVPLFKSTNPLWSANDPISGFLYNYGVWFNPDLSSPNGRLVNRRYLFTAPADGFYDWQFAAELVGYFSIDGTVLGDTRQAKTADEALTGYKGSTFLTAGQHVVQLAGANLFNPTSSNPLPQAAIALTVKHQDSGALVWSTLKPVRGTETFPGWSEVYRIPLVSVGSGVPQTYYSGGFMLKDTGALYGMYRWQDLFGDYTRGSQGAGSLFVITDDGYGNLSIRNQYKTVTAGDSGLDQTTNQLQYITYYYNTLDFNSPQGQDFSEHAQRVHQLDPGPQGDGSQCHQFVGFDYLGNVQTILTKYPGYQNYDPVPRYLIGSLNLSTTGIPTGQGLRSSLINLATNPALWALGIGYVLWSGGLADFLLCTSLGASIPFGIEIGTFLSTFTAGGEAAVFAGQVFSYGASVVGELFGTSDAIGTLIASQEIGAGVTFLGVVGSAIPYVAVAYLVFAYGGQLWHAIGDVISSIPVVGDIWNAAGDVISGITGGGSVICSKLHELGILPDDIYVADEQFGKLLREEHMYIYEGYRVWADTVVDWMNGKGPDMIVWEKDSIKRREQLTAFITEWATIIAVPWAEHMAYRMGVREKDNYTGRVLMYLGIPLCAAVGKWQQQFGKNEKPAGWVKGATIIGTASVFRTIAGVGKVVNNTKNLIAPVKLLENHKTS